MAIEREWERKTSCSLGSSRSAWTISFQIGIVNVQDIAENRFEGIVRKKTKEKYLREARTSLSQTFWRTLIADTIWGCTRTSDWWSLLEQSVEHKHPAEENAPTPDWKEKNNPKSKVQIVVVTWRFQWHVVSNHPSRDREWRLNEKIFLGIEAILQNVLVVFTPEHFERKSSSSKHSMYPKWPSLGTSLARSLAPYR